MDVTGSFVEEEPTTVDNKTNSAKNQDTSVHDDFKREMKL